MEQAYLGKSQVRGGNSKSVWQTGFPKLDAFIKVVFSLGFPSGLFIAVFVYIIIPIVTDYRTNNTAITGKLEQVKETISSNGQITHDLLRDIKERLPAPVTVGAAPREEEAKQ